MTRTAPGRDALIELQRSYHAGRISRDQLWSGVQACSKVILQFGPLLQDGDVEAMELGRAGNLLRLRNGLRFEWNPDDLRSPPNMALIHGSYEPEERTLLETLARDARTILDVGANVGWYAVHLAKATKAGHLHAFEPIPATGAALRRNLALNDCEAKVTVHSFGLGERKATVPFFIPKDVGTVAASRAPLFAEQENQELRCDIETLDAWSQASGISGIDLVKIDIEGSELLFFRGGLATLGRNLPVIFCEMLRKWSAKFQYHPNDIIAALAPLGYACWELRPSGPRQVGAVTEETIATNFLFLHTARHMNVPAQLSGLHAHS